LKREWSTKSAGREKKIPVELCRNLPEVYLKIFKENLRRQI
jgi:hypothetical protein